ncbi:MAG: DUF2939 domain-containing protein [Sphingomicrobium sp.]
MKSVLAGIGLLIAAVVGWYEASPLYTLKQMRDAATAGNTAKLANYVDYQALKIDLKDEVRRELILEGNRRGAERDPLARFGTDLAVALVPVGVDLLVTPEAVQAMFDGRSAANQGGRGSVAAGGSTVGVMPVGIPRTDAVIERTGLSEFKVRVKGKDGAAVFRRYGLRWKLAGVDMPYKFGGEDRP